MEEKSQHPQPDTGKPENHDEPVISNRPKDPNWLGVGSESDAPRTLGNHPVDPNGAGAKANVPPGVSSDAARDPGRQTPDAPKVENRS